MNGVYLLEDGEKYWYIAKSSTAVRSFHASEYDLDPEEFVITRLPDTQQLQITMDEPGRPEICVSCAEWIRRTRIQGPVTELCSTVF